MVGDMERKYLYKVSFTYEKQRHYFSFVEDLDRSSILNNDTGGIRPLLGVAAGGVKLACETFHLPIEGSAKNVILYDGVTDDVLYICSAISLKDDMELLNDYYDRIKRNNNK